MGKGKAHARPKWRPDKAGGGSGGPGHTPPQKRRPAGTSLPREDVGCEPGVDDYDRYLTDEHWEAVARLRLEQLQEKHRISETGRRGITWAPEEKLEDVFLFCKHAPPSERSERTSVDSDEASGSDREEEPETESRGGDGEQGDGHAEAMPTMAMHMGGHAHGPEPHGGEEACPTPVQDCPAPSLRGDVEGEGEGEEEGTSDSGQHDGSVDGPASSSCGDDEGGEGGRSSGGRRQKQREAEEQPKTSKALKKQQKKQKQRELARHQQQGRGSRSGSDSDE